MSRRSLPVASGLAPIMFFCMLVLMLLKGCLGGGSGITPSCWTETDGRNHWTECDEGVEEYWGTEEYR